MENQKERIKMEKCALLKQRVVVQHKGLIFQYRCELKELMSSCSQKKQRRSLSLYNVRLEALNNLNHWDSMMLQKGN